MTEGEGRQVEIGLTRLAAMALLSSVPVQY